jgi:hypothetical protein
MEFIVTATTGTFHRLEHRPCKGARLKEVKVVDKRFVDSLEVTKQEPIWKLWGRDWWEAGTNHRVYSRGVVARDLPTIPEWVVDINTMDELLAIHRQVNHPLIISDSSNHAEPEIEIYDDYRE